MEIYEKLKKIRNAIELSQSKFADLVDVPLGTYRRYEQDQSEITGGNLEKILSHPECEKYVLWFMTGKTNSVANQIAPGEESAEIAQQKAQITQVEYEEKFVKTVGDTILMFCHLDWFVPNTDKVDFNDCGKIILKDVRPLIETRYKTSNSSNNTKSA